MRILIIGYSNIVRKRVIPALEKIADTSEIIVDVASQSSTQIELSEKIKGEIFNDYDEALSKTCADIVYISTVNSAHAQLAEKALLKDLHTVVDKPAFTDYEDAKKLIDLAKKKKLLSGLVSS